MRSKGNFIYLSFDLRCWKKDNELFNQYCNRFVLKYHIKCNKYEIQAAFFVYVNENRGIKLSKFNYIINISYESRQKETLYITKYTPAKTIFLRMERTLFHGWVAMKPIFVSAKKKFNAGI